MLSIELLAPAKNLEQGLIAIDCGADALYVGGPAFGARQAAQNELYTLRPLLDHAHRFGVKVYLTLNTILSDSELKLAVSLIREAYDMGFDAIIIQDVGLLECELPPIPLIASTQMGIRSPERAQFLKQQGLNRVILERALSLEEIAAIHQANKSLELEVFVHGAICVGYSGECYLSAANGGRSANRGACAQPCRKPYQLLDENNAVIASETPVLSLKDLSLIHQLEALLTAGVTSFKIEGRLKDKAYVATTVLAYRQALDKLIEPSTQWHRNSWGKINPTFTPNTEKVFHRGQTDYFLLGRPKTLHSGLSAAFRGEWVGAVESVAGKTLTLQTEKTLSIGEGLCWETSQGTLEGGIIDNTSSEGLVFRTHVQAKVGSDVWRNADPAYDKRATHISPRELNVSWTCDTSTDGVWLTLTSESGYTVGMKGIGLFEAPREPERAVAAWRKQLSRTGGTGFCVESVHFNGTPSFVPMSVINDWRRTLVSRLEQLMLEERCRPVFFRDQGGQVNISKEPALRANIDNMKSRQFYQKRGVPIGEPSKVLMRTRYCLAFEWGRCPRMTGKALGGDWKLVDIHGASKVHFRCDVCEMEIQ